VLEELDKFLKECKVLSKEVRLSPAAGATHYRTIVQNSVNSDGGLRNASSLIAVQVYT